MPQSLIINLVTQSAVASKHLQGYSLQQLFFNLVEVVDPELGHVLRRDKKNCSYGLSALQLSLADPPNSAMPVTNSEPSLHQGKTPGCNPTLSASSAKVRSIHQPFLEKKKKLAKETSTVVQALTQRTLQFSHVNAIAPQTNCWWRISFLDDALFGHLIYLWNQLRDEVFYLGDASVKIASIALEQTTPDGSSSCTYRDLYEQASAQERNIHLYFVTPTTFQLGGHTTPLPTVEAVFQPLRKYWNRYSGLVFAPSLIDNIIPIDFDIKTQPVQNILRNSVQPVMGCTGRISFRVGGHGDPLIIKRINALANFAQYCGIGLNTQFGMGVVRRLGSSCMRTYMRSEKTRNPLVEQRHQ